MWNQSIRLDIFEELLFTNRFFLEDILFKGAVSTNILNSRNTFFQELNSLFPNSSPEEKMNFLYLMTKAYNRSNIEKMQLIWSGPSISGLPGRDTEIVFEDYISSAQESIILSIYSLSEYASSLINLLEKKIKQGIYVEIYVNEYASKKDLLDQIINLDSGRAFVYEYIGAENETQSLHAKVLTIDNKKSIITSSNLSYNGMDGNLELGVILNSKEKAREIRLIFNTLIERYYFRRIKY
jgi:phosphatidylserine/phosphatidylglycerophosphate/cardiolipin synthase-like enzyme